MILYINPPKTDKIKNKHYKSFFGKFLCCQSNASKRRIVLQNHYYCRAYQTW